MNIVNLEFLHSRLKYLGFNENTLLNQQLQEKISAEVPAFELYTDEYFDRSSRLEAKLFFHKVENEDLYVFDKYEATLYYEREPQVRKQTFKIFRGRGVTLKQAFNLLDGRSAWIQHSDFYGASYETWARLDFEEKDRQGNFRLKEYRHGYDLEKVLEMYPIQELETAKTKDQLIESLRRGNLHRVIFKQAKPELKLIAADPEGGSIKIYKAALGAGKKEMEQRMESVKGVPSAAPDAVGEEEEEDEPVSPERKAPAKSTARKAG